MDTRHIQSNKSSQDFSSEEEKRHHNSPAFFRAAKTKKSNFYLEFDMLKAQYLKNEISIQQLVQALNLITPPAHIKQPYTSTIIPALYIYVLGTNQPKMAVDLNKLYQAVTPDKTPALSKAVFACAVDAFKSKWNIEDCELSSSQSLTNNFK